MNSWRHIWKYQPTVRIFVFCATAGIIFTQLIYTRIFFFNFLKLND